MEDWVLSVRKRAESNGKAIVSSGRSRKFEKISFDDLNFIAASLFERTPVDYFKEQINSETVLGKTSKKPLRLSMPLLAAAMSFGALSKQAKIAVAKATAIAGTAANTGEGGMLEEERKEAKLLIAQYSTGRFGVDEEYLRKADAVEIKFGQGAKPGQGGLLLKEKVTVEIARVRKVKLGEDIHSPPSHADIKNLQDLKEKVKWLKKVTGGKPVIVKIAAGNIENDVKIAVQSNCDIIAIDGMGGTGAAPEVMLHEFGIPIAAVIAKARKIMDKLKASQELIVGGGFSKGGEVAKALALGANAVFVGEALLVSMGCIYCRQCYTGKCPFGITTQDSEFLKKFLGIEQGAARVASFLKSCNEEVKMVAGACGYNDVHKLNKENLKALSKEISEITGVKMP